MPKNKNIVCIFAHPDDEAFGPSGTIAKWALSNNVYLICVTDVCNKKGKITKLGKTRRNELLKSAQILGIRKVFFLGYSDGELRNNIYHKVSDEIKKILIDLKPHTLMTFELRGVSGHLDHVFTAMVSSYLYRKLRFIKEIYYFTEHKLVSNFMKNYFIYFPEGYDKAEVDHVENVSHEMDIKIKAINTHKSQKKDAAMILKKLKYFPKEEMFLVKRKTIKNNIAKYLKIVKDLSGLLLHKAK